MLKEGSFVGESYTVVQARKDTTTTPPTPTHPTPNTNKTQTKPRTNLEGGEETREVSRDPPGLASEQLQSIRVFLLRHEAAPRAVGVREGNALGVVVDDEVLRQLGEVRQGQRRPPEVLHHEVAVAHRVLFLVSKLQSTDRRVNIKISKHDTEKPLYQHIFNAFLKSLSGCDLYSSTGR